MTTHNTPSEPQAEKSFLVKHLDILHDQRNEAMSQAYRWKRIATSLYVAMTDPDVTESDREWAIEDYLNYMNPDD